MSDKALTKEDLMSFLADHASVDLTLFQNGNKATAEQSSNWLWEDSEDCDLEEKTPFKHFNPEGGSGAHFVVYVLNRLGGDRLEFELLSEGDKEIVVKLNSESHVLKIDKSTFEHDDLWIWCVSAKLMQMLEEADSSLRFAYGWPYLFTLRGKDIATLEHYRSELNRVTGWGDSDNFDASPIVWAVDNFTNASKGT